ncbi:MAG: phosphatase PAP2 family protein [Pseudorhodoplanes sp.]
MTAESGESPAAPARWMQAVRENVAQGFTWLLRPSRPRLLQRTGISLGVWLATGAVLLVAITLWQMVMFDAAGMRFARTLPHSLVDGFNFLTDFGKSGWFLIPLGAALFAVALFTTPSLPRMTRAVLATIAMRCSFAFLAIALPSVFVSLLKRVIGRARPITGSFDPFAYMPPVWRSDYASMPSGHTTTAFAAAFAVAALWPRLAPAMAAYALIIAASRVVVLAHYPSDAVAGAFVGLAGAFLVREYFAARGLVFAVDPSGGISPKPGPSWRRIKAIARPGTGQ